MSAEKGTILLVTRHYPPSVSGGARRPALLAAGLRQRGWRVYVASPYAPLGELNWIETPHPAGARGDRADAASGSGARDWTTRARAIIRRALYWPDGDMRWALSVAKAVKRSGFAPDIVLTTSPPESAHLAGIQIKRTLGAAWVAELRDSWIEDPLREELRSSRIRRALERRIAQHLLSRADHIVAASDPILREVREFHLKPQPPTTTIGHFARLGTASYRFDGPGPHFLHSGRFTLSHPERRIEILLGAFARAAAETPQARLHLAGRLTEGEVQAVREAPLATNMVLHGEIAYDAALSMQRAADGLIVFQQGTSALPGKLSEYMLTSAPILVVGDGPWRQRLRDIAHFPLERAATALAGQARSPTDSLAEALNSYEEILERMISGR